MCPSDFQSEFSNYVSLYKVTLKELAKNLQFRKNELTEFSYTKAIQEFDSTFHPGFIPVKKSALRYNISYNFQYLKH